MVQRTSRTFSEWLQLGRSVRRGQKAAFYLVNPARTTSLAIFEEAQTEPWDAIDVSDWTEIVPAAQRPERLKGKPKIKLDYVTATGVLVVWCGPNEKAIKILKKNGFEFNSDEGYRWRAQRDGISKPYDGFEKWGFDVDATLDGQPWEPQVPVV